MGMEPLLAVVFSLTQERLAGRVKPTTTRILFLLAGITSWGYFRMMEYTKEPLALKWLDDGRRNSISW